MFGLFSKKKIPLKEQLISELGISLNPEIKPELLAKEFSHQEFEKEPYAQLLMIMGGEIYKDDRFYIVSNDIWHLDAECIEDHGDYAAIVQRLGLITGIDIKNTRDFVDIENETAWVSFEYNGNFLKWDLQVDADWLDLQIFDLFSELIKEMPAKKIAIATLGQDCLIACLSEQQMKEINRLTKKNFQFSY